MRYIITSSIAPTCLKLFYRHCSLANVSMHIQALTNVNTTQAWIGRSEHLKGGNQGLGKHASKMQMSTLIIMMMMMIQVMVMMMMMMMMMMTCRTRICPCCNSMLIALDRQRALGRIGEGILGRGVCRPLGVSHSSVRRLQDRFLATVCAEDHREC